MFEIKRRIKYDSERQPNFANEIKAIPGCENLEKCIQCGTCSGSCPLSIYMDHPPRRIIELTRSGFSEDVLKSFTIWLCASCYACTVECPKNIGITNIMYALKQRAMREKVYPKKFPIPILAQEFFKMVKSKGRVSECLLVMNLFLKALLSKVFKMRNLGINLMKTGRFSLKSESMKNPKELEKLLKAFKEKEHVSS